MKKRSPYSRVSPQVANNEFLDVKAAYQINETSRFRRERRGIPLGGAGGNWHISEQQEYFRGIEVARDIARNDNLCGQGLLRAADQIVQGGFQLDPNTGDAELDKDILEMWAEWSDPENARMCDASGKMSFSEMERAAIFTIFRDGDLGVNPLESGQLQFLESHRIRTPDLQRKFKIINGVQVNKTSAPIRYWVTNEEVSTKLQVRVADVTPIAALDKEGNPNFFHLFDPLSFTLQRGVTKLNPIVDIVTMHDDIQFSKALQQQIVSSFALIRERDETFSGTNDDEDEEFGLEVGMEIRGKPGERWRMDSPNVPNAEFFEQMRALQILIGINIGLPHALLTLDPSDTNFSGWRGAMDQARVSFARHQDWLRKRFHRLVYLWKLRNWVRKDGVMNAHSKRSDINIFKHTWIAATWRYIQPEVESKTDDLLMTRGIKPPSAVIGGRGGTFDNHCAKTIADRVKGIKMAKEAQASDPILEDVPWQALVPFPIPGIAVMPKAEEGNNNNDDDDDDDDKKRQEDDDKKPEKPEKSRDVKATPDKRKES